MYCNCPYKQYSWCWASLQLWLWTIKLQYKNIFDYLQDLKRKVPFIGLVKQEFWAIHQVKWPVGEFEMSHSSSVIHDIFLHWNVMVSSSLALFLENPLITGASGQCLGSMKRKWIILWKANPVWVCPAWSEIPEHMEKLFSIRRYLWQVSKFPVFSSVHFFL